MCCQHFFLLDAFVIYFCKYLVSPLFIFCFVKKKIRHFSFRSFLSRPFSAPSPWSGPATSIWPCPWWAATTRCAKRWNSCSGQRSWPTPWSAQTRSVEGRPVFAGASIEAKRRGKEILFNASNPVGGSAFSTISPKQCWKDMTKLCNKS